MNMQGKVRGFTAYTPKIMEQMKNDLKLTLPLQALLYCSSYYRKQEKRDPFIEELKMLDRFASATPTSASLYAPSELLTNDAFVADTYADLLNKRRVLRPTVKYPCTVAEALTLASSYLERVGKAASLPSKRAVLESASSLPFSDGQNNMLASPYGNLRMRLLSKSREPLEAGDLLLILRPMSNDRAERYGASIGSLLEQASVSERIKQIFFVSESGLLDTLLSVADGLHIDPSKLSVTGEPISLSMLVGLYDGSCIVRIARKDHEGFFRAAQQHGVRAIAFASVATGARFDILNGRHPLFSLESAFLRSLIPIRAISARLANEHPAKLADIKRETATVNACTYIRKQKNETGITPLSDLLCATAASHPEHSFFLNTVDTLLAPILALAAAGCDYGTQRLALGVELPQGYTEPAVAGECLSMLLGIYRVQAELSIPADTAKAVTVPEIVHPRVSVFAMSNASPLAPPATFTKAENRIYCIAPDRLSNGLPDFASLRKLLEMLTTLRRNGILQSARLLCRESLTDGIKRMGSGRLCCHYTGDAFLEDTVLPLAILIEATEKIPAKQIGVVAEKQAYTPPKASDVDVLLKPLIRSEKPTVLLIAQKSDRAAEQLMATLIGKGADIQLFLEDSADADALARALLRANVLIICGNTKITSTPQTDFAADAFCNAGGTVLLLGGAKWSRGGKTIALQNGFSDKNIEQICHF